ncbi:MAG: CAP domain-containing protein [Deltaproteobacteria bacterium]|nr:CAP domain-containing protein [Deltaproteobacteria bacterium]
MIAAGQNPVSLRAHLQQTCQSAGVRDVEACIKAAASAIDTYREKEQKKYLQDAARKPDSAQCMTPAEYKMFENLNRDRVKKNIRPVAVDCDLVKAARGHSADMARFGFFNHTNREGKSPHERIKAKTSRFRCTAENIARGGTGPHTYTWSNVDSKAQTGLFKSPGHRKNILNPDMTHVGIGIYRGTYEGADNILFVTQNFGGCEQP